LLNLITDGKNCRSSFSPFQLRITIAILGIMED